MNIFEKSAVNLWNGQGGSAVYSRIDIPLTEESRGLIDGTLFSLATISYALGRTLQQFPGINSYVFFGMRIRRKNVKLSFMVNNKRGEYKGLTFKPVTVDRSESFSDYNLKVKEALVDCLRNPYAPLGWTAHVIKWLPTFLLQFIFPIYNILSFAPGLGFLKPVIERDIFGSAVISHLGSLGLPGAYLPLVPMTKASVILGLGKIEARPRLIKGQWIEEKILPVFITVDHRVTHGPELAQFYKAFEKELAEFQY